MIVAPLWCETQPPPRTAPPVARAPRDEDATAPAGDLVCATCARRITHDDHRIVVNGAHEHTFVNPGGFVHVVGCFALATGLAYVGEPESAFSWFPGFRWQIAACGGCRTHLGWIFRAAGDERHRSATRLASRGEARSRLGRDRGGLCDEPPAIQFHGLLPAQLRRG